MRTIASDVSVRLYHLDEDGEGGAATTLLYGTLGEAMAAARDQPAAVQDALFIATDNDVVAYRDIADD